MVSGAELVSGESGLSSLGCAAGLVVCTGDGSGEYTGGDEVGVSCSAEDVVTAGEYGVGVEGGMDESPSSQSSPSSAVE